MIEVMFTVLLFCLAYLAQLRCWSWICEVTGWVPGNLWVHLGAAVVAAQYSAWTWNTMQEWLEDWRSRK